MKNTSPALNIRPAQPQDVPLLLQLIHGLALYEGRPEAVSATETSLHEWLFCRHAAEVLIAENEGVTAGYVIFYPLFSSFAGAGRLYVEDIFILPALRGAGYGTQLLRHIALLAAQRGYTGLEWGCLNSNSPALAFYNALGASIKSGSTSFSLQGEALARFINA